VGLEAALAVSALLDVDAFRPAVDAFRPAVDAPRIAVPWNNTPYQHTYRVPPGITIQITTQGDLKVQV
jgi:hypothetical protein